MERKVDFVACHMPGANAFMINVYAAVAQEERRMISDRTKASLAAAKARGVKFGGPRLPAAERHGVCHQSAQLPVLVPGRPPVALR